MVPPTLFVAARRRHGPDRRDRPDGAAARLRGRGAMAERCESRRQSLADPVQKLQRARNGGEGARHLRPARRAASNSKSPKRCCWSATTMSSPRSMACARSASACRSTISAPAIRRSPICAPSRSRRSRSTRASSKTCTSTRTSQAIVRAILSLGQNLGLAVTAEGIENGEDLAFLIGEGCQEGQGYLFSEARAAHDLFPANDSVASQAAPVAEISEWRLAREDDDQERGVG